MARIHQSPDDPLDESPHPSVEQVLLLDHGIDCKPSDVLVHLRKVASKSGDSELSNGTCAALWKSLHDQGLIKESAARTTGRSGLLQKAGLINNLIDFQLESKAKEDVRRYIKQLKKSAWQTDNWGLLRAFGLDALNNWRFLCHLVCLSKHCPDFGEALALLKEYQHQRQAGNIQCPGVGRLLEWTRMDVERATATLCPDMKSCTFGCEKASKQGRNKAETKQKSKKRRQTTGGDDGSGNKQASPAKAPPPGMNSGQTAVEPAAQEVGEKATTVLEKEDGSQQAHNTPESLASQRLARNATSPVQQPPAASPAIANVGKTRSRPSGPQDDGISTEISSAEHHNNADEPSLIASAGNTPTYATPEKGRRGNLDLHDEPSSFLFGADGVDDNNDDDSWTRSPAYQLPPSIDVDEDDVFGNIMEGPDTELGPESRPKLSRLPRLLPRPLRNTSAYVTSPHLSALTPAANFDLNITADATTPPSSPSFSHDPQLASTPVTITAYEDDMAAPDSPSSATSSSKKPRRTPAVPDWNERCLEHWLNLFRPPSSDAVDLTPQPILHDICQLDNANGEKGTHLAGTFACFQDDADPKQFATINLTTGAVFASHEEAAGDALEFAAKYFPDLELRQHQDAQDTKDTTRDEAALYFASVAALTARQQLDKEQAPVTQSMWHAIVRGASAFAAYKKEDAINWLLEELRGIAFSSPAARRQMSFDHLGHSAKHMMEAVYGPAMLLDLAEAREGSLDECIEAASFVRRSVLQPADVTGTPFDELMGQLRSKAAHGSAAKRGQATRLLASYKHHIDTQSQVRSRLCQVLADAIVRWQEEKKGLDNEMKNRRRACGEALKAAADKLLGEDV